MAKLTMDELRDLVASNVPDATVSPRHKAATPPPSARPVPDRATLAAKVHAVVADSAPAIEELAPLTEESTIVDYTVVGPDGNPLRQAVVVSTTTGEITAEQG